VTLTAVGVDVPPQLRYHRTDMDTQLSKACPEQRDRIKRPLPSSLHASLHGFGRTGRTHCVKLTAAPVELARLWVG